MNGAHVGILQEDDPLYGFLRSYVLGVALKIACDHPIFDVYRLDQNTPYWSVYQYVERNTYTAVVGKFYGNKWLDGRSFGDHDYRAAMMQQEYDYLQRLRNLGFDQPPHQFVRPLAVNAAINCVLVEEFVPGPSLSAFIWEGLRWQQSDRLCERLAAVARFLVDLHERSPSLDATDGAAAMQQAVQLIDQLSGYAIIGSAQQKRLLDLCDGWAASGLLETGRKVLIHGDPRPGHFFFDHDQNVTAIDLETHATGDCAVDLGYLLAEIKHRFFTHTGTTAAGEPLIRHFFTAYREQMPGGEEAFNALTTRCRFYMACFQLRVGLSPWVDLTYRRRLIDDAEATLTT